LPRTRKIENAQPVTERLTTGHEVTDFDLLEILAFEIPTKGLQRRSIASRARIIDAASEAFMSKGYAGVSTHEISADAGVTQGLIAYHFKSKDGLWQAAMDQVFGNFRNSLIERIRQLHSTDERTLVAEVIRHVVRLALRYPSIIRFMVESGPHADDHLTWLLTRHIQPIYSAVTHIFEVAKGHGVLRPLPVANAYYVLLTSGSIFSLEAEVRVIAGQNVRSDSFADAHVQCMLTMLMTDCSPSAPMAQI
jgi:TetR/AcrR family transcriptional regulator